MEGTRSYDDGEFVNLKATELRLGLPGTDEEPKTPARGVKRALEAESPGAKRAQVVGWPPVRTYRKNAVQAARDEGEGGGKLVKVSMDGAPYLRKIDMKVYMGYKELREALENLFKFFSFESDHAVTYEDKDGDWMLVGDVPWGMFTSSCKRLRIMRGSEARGLGSTPDACKHR